MRILFALLIVAFFNPINASAQENERVLDIQKVVSNGGIEAWLVEDHSVPVIAMKFGFKDAGAKQDGKDKQGLSRMLSNTMDEGAGNLDAKEFQKALRDDVISLSFSASRDHFTGSLKTLTKNKARAFQLTQLALTKPRFDKEAVDRMRNANQSRIRSSLSDPGWMAARVLNDKAFEGHPYALNSGGTLSSLAGIDSDDLKEFHKTHIGKNNLVVSVAGDISADELRVVLDDVFGKLPDVEIQSSQDIEVQNQGQLFTYDQDIPQTIVEMMQPSIGRKDPRYQTGQVMNFILGSSGFGSRLTEVIREQRGLTYGIYSYFYDLDHVSGLSVSTSTENKNVGEMLSLINAEFKRIQNNPVTDKEIEDAKNYLIGSLPLSLTSTDKIAGLMSSIQLDGLPMDYLDTRQLAIQNVSAADIQALAADILNPENFTTVLVGRPEFGDNAPETQSVKTLPNVE